MNINRIAWPAAAVLALLSAAGTAQADCAAEFDSGNYKKALSTCRGAAKADDPVALNVLGQMYGNGLGVKADYRKAAAFFTRSAELGNSGAQYYLGRLYAAGQGVDQSDLIAVELFRKAAREKTAFLKEKQCHVHPVIVQIPQEVEQALLDAAQLAVYEYVKHTISVIFLLNKTYEPYYKWAFKALRTLPILSIEAEVLQYLLTTDNEGKMAEEKYDVIESIC